MAMTKAMLVLIKSAYNWVKLFSFDETPNFVPKVLLNNFHGHP